MRLSDANLFKMKFEPEWWLTKAPALYMTHYKGEVPSLATSIGASGVYFKSKESFLEKTASDIESYMGNLMKYTGLQLE